MSDGDFRWDPIGSCHVADAKTDFDGWTIVGSERWKPGVMRLYCTKSIGNKMQYRVVYTKDEYVPDTVKKE